MTFLPARPFPHPLLRRRAAQLALGLEPSPRRLPVARHPLPDGAAAADTGFDAAGQAIGRAYARHGLMPPADHLHAGHPVRRGWEAARVGAPTCSGPATRHVERWLGLRLTAWLRGLPFDELQVTPRLLARIDARRCPVTREPLTFGAAAPTDAVVALLHEPAGVVAGNLAVMSRRAAQALAASPAPDPAPATSLEPAASQRLQALRSFVQAAPHAQAAAQPLAVLPPVRVRVLNPAQALQVLLTTFHSAGSYARRMTELGALVPGPAARRAYAVFMSALLARRLEAGWAVGPEQVREVLEDAWLHEGVQQRWAALAQALGEAGCERLVHRALQHGLAAAPMRWLEPGRAVEGWGGYSAQS